MAFEIVFAAEACEDLKGFEGGIQSTVKKSIERHLRNEPRRISKSRIKRLRGLKQPQYRLRIDQIRIFYDVNVVLERVEILRIFPKLLSIDYLIKEGVSDEDVTTN